MMYETAMFVASIFACMFYAFIVGFCWYGWVWYIHEVITWDKKLTFESMVIIPFVFVASLFATTILVAFVFKILGW